MHTQTLSINIHALINSRIKYTGGWRIDKIIKKIKKTLCYTLCTELEQVTSLVLFALKSITITDLYACENGHKN